jgi:hypothetical protein
VEKGYDGKVVITYIKEYNESLLKGRANYTRYCKNWDGVSL